MKFACLSDEVGTVPSEASGRLVTEKLSRSLTPRAAIALELIIHELATNATKHGALSSPVGNVTVKRLVDDGTRFVSEWRESGGPAVVPPTRQGFGQTVISRSLQYSDTGGAETDFDPDGLVCRISMPMEDLHD